MFTSTAVGQNYRGTLMGPNGQPVHIFSWPGVTSNRPVQKNVPRGTKAEAERVAAVMEYIELTYNELLLDRLWVSSGGKEIEANLQGFNPQWIRLRRDDGKVNTVPIHKLGEISRDKVEKLTRMRTVVTLWRREKDKVTQHNVRKSITLMEETLGENFGDIDSLLTEMVVRDIIKRGTIGHYKELSSQLDLRMVVAGHFAGLYNGATGSEVTAEQMNRKFLNAGRTNAEYTERMVREQEGSAVIWTYTNPSRFPDRTSRITLAEYVDAMIDLAKNGSDEKLRDPQYVRDPLPTPSF